MKKLLFFTSVAFLFLLRCSDNSDPDPVTDIGIYINEIRSTGGDWLEIYNSTSATVSLSGFKVYDDPSDKYTIPTGTIAGNSFFILNCDGIGVDGNASFRLSASGETVYLEDNTGNLIDKVTFPALTNGVTYARFPDGGDTWSITGLATKNKSNGTDQAPAILLVTRTPIVPGLDDAVFISATVTDVSGVSSVKLYYRKDSDLFISVAMALTAGAYTETIPATGTTGTIEYYVEATNIKNVVTVDPDNAPLNTRSYLLNTDDISSLQASLKINEFLASNTSCCADNSSGTAEFDDWIEIYNGTTNPIDLSGFYLSDDRTNPFKFRIEDTTTIPANGYLVVWADEQGSQGNLHANFQLDVAGEQVGLYYIDGREIDHHIYGSQTPNVSWGRATNGAATWKSWNNPTPGSSNQ